MIIFIVSLLLILSIILFISLVSPLFRTQENELKEELMKSLPDIINGNDDRWILCDIHNNVISFTSLMGRYSFYSETFKSSIFSSKEYNLDVKLINKDEVNITVNDVKENKSFSFNTKDTNILIEFRRLYNDFC